MRRALMLAVVLGVAGCGDPPPGSRLSPGDKVLLVLRPPGKSLFVWNATGQHEIAPGSRAVVAADQGDEKDLFRDVTVNVEGGPDDGLAGRVSRAECQPIR